MPLRSSRFCRNDNATTDRVAKLIDYAEVPSLRCYVLLEQTVVAATLFRRDRGAPGPPARIPRAIWSCRDSTSCCRSRTCIRG
jgi:hypothetical protein